MTEPTAAGWYPDSEDTTQLRYFDGVVWTRHTTPLVSPTAGSSTIGRAPGVSSAAEREGQQGHQQAPSPQWSAPPAWGTTRADVLPDGAVLAEWWRRLFGRVIDWVLTSVVSGLLSLPFVGPLVDAFREYVRAAVTAAESGGSPDDAALQAAILEIALPVTIIGLVVALVYETAFLVWKSATPGKMLLGTVVRRQAEAGPVGLAVALRRQAIMVLSNLLSLLPLATLLGSVISVVDPAWLLWDPKRQTLHDKVADTVVVLRR